ncbi:hypothetical protein LZ30DRAFT_775020 [Colletotrichum cereale]|nr:hypothetical protein LZ30DRAFT_775020 [Colletotrichum cereale]
MSGDHFKPEDSSAKRGLGRDSDDGIGSDSAKRQRTCREDYTGGQRNEKKAPSIRFLPTEYTVGWVCALWIEMAAGLAMLDRIHGSLPTTANDSNEYILGNVGAHNVVMACLGSYGTNNAATVASNMLRSFPSIHVRLMVGIGGGVPGDVDIRLGDIVVGERVIQHGLGKIVPGDRVQRTGISKTRCPTIEILGDLFRNAVLALGHRRLTCFVDALDECDEQQVREMVAYFEDLGEQATADNIKLKVCFSSRHYPQINVRKGIQLILENQNGHEQDLEKYVRSRLTRGPSSYIDKIRTQILEKADGVFMWVVLVVDVLNKEIDRGRLFIVDKRLREMPSQLSELFKDILRRDNDNMEDLLLCIQWILFAKRPLNRKEYYFAILSGLPECDEEFITYDPERNTDEGMEDFVISSSKGLAEITKAKSGTVQFIHESVRDFLIKDNGLKELWPRLGDGFQSLSHEKLKQCCHSYISRDHSGRTHISDVEALPKANTEQGKEHRQIALEQLPFLEYATENVLHHANIAAGGVLQEEFLDRFQLKGWFHLNNIHEKHQIRRMKHEATAKILIENGADVFHISFGRSPLLVAAKYSGDNIIKLLLENGVSTDCSTLDKRTPLHLAASRGHEGVVKCLLSKGVFVEPADSLKGSTPLHEAARKGFKDVVRALLEYGSSVDFRDKTGQTALHEAAANGREAVARILLENGAS